jgi:predicted membrane protein
MNHFRDRHAMRQYRQRQPAVQVVIGAVIATLGVLFTLENLHILRARDFLRYWPIVFVAIGAAQIAQARTSARIWSGSIWIAIGGVLLASRLGLWDVNIWAFWPLLLVFAGGRIFWQASRGAGTGDPTGTEPTVSAIAVLGGFDRKVASPGFQRAELTAFMGGGNLDLREATLADGRAVVDVFAMMGGFEILVPDTWRVKIEVTPFMGGCDDKTISRAGENAPCLVIRGFVMMGGVDIKNSR